MANPNEFLENTNVHSSYQAPTSGNTFGVQQSSYNQAANTGLNRGG
jgi:hypothetical protein